jgi:hypothetical protein
MKKNMGNLDRIIRLIIAVFIGILFVMKIITGTWAIILLILGGIFVITALAARCPIYAPLKIQTNPPSGQTRN